MSNIAYTAADEIDRREVNRTLPKAEKVAGPKSPEGARLLGMSAADLRTEAGLTAPVKATRTRTKPAAKAKPARTATQVKHTNLRAAAFAWHRAEYHAGRKTNLAAAYVAFGTAPASVTNAPGYAG